MNSMALSARFPSLIEIDPTVSTPSALPDRIYGVLKHRILTCGMSPGARIIEKVLCDEMRVSRTPLREALNRLVLEGLVSLVPYRGYAVAPLTVDGFRELCELRRIVESGTAALSAERATPDETARLSAAATLHYTPGDRQTYEAYLRANSAFHLTLVQCAGNGHLEAIVMSALDKHQRPLYLGLDVGVDAAAATREHFEIVDAVRSHDRLRAHDLMVQHISRAEARITAALRQAGF
jgi:GntR family transcriptional regulator, rspAB operon transcriptional repressor